MPNALHSSAALQTPADIAQALVGGFAHLKIPVGFGTADAAVLYTVPAGVKFEVTGAYWEVVTGFTGGASSAIGLSSSNTAYNTGGDLLGAAGGDLTATVGTAGYKGAKGTKLAAGYGVVLVAGDTIKFNRIASAYTAGAGFAHISGRFID